jgi:hypothetical protein
MKKATRPTPQISTGLLWLAAAKVSERNLVDRGYQRTLQEDLGRNVPRPMVTIDSHFSIVRSLSHSLRHATESEAGDDDWGILRGREKVEGLRVQTSMFDTRVVDVLDRYEDGTHDFRGFSIT